MKLIGFIKQHSKGTYATDIIEYISTPNNDREALINYLNKGILLLPFMGGVDNCIEEKDEEYFGYVAVYTDGEWIWPQYIVEYLKKYENFNLNTEFTNHVKLNINKKIKISDKEIIVLEKQAYKLLGWTKDNVNRF